MIQLDQIELNPKICNGKPVIKGTRIPISVILEQIAEGESWDTLLAGYPELRLQSLGQLKDHLIILSSKRTKWIHTA